MYCETALNYFTILEMSPTSDLDIIKKSYRTIAMKYHPDRNPGDPHAEERFKKINEAFEFLSNPLNLRQDFSSPTWTNEDRDLWDEDNRIITKGGHQDFQIELPTGMSLERFMEILKTDPNIKDLDVNLPYLGAHDPAGFNRHSLDKNQQYLGAGSPNKL